MKDIIDQTVFNTTCFAIQNDTSVKGIVNAWFDPIDPLASISPQEICDLHFQLFTSLKEKSRSSLSEYVSFSYLASLDLFVNANMQEDYENCVNLNVVLKPNEWTTNFVTNNPVFLIWDSASKLQVAAQVAQTITSACAN